MQLCDKDLLSVQETRSLVEQAGQAQKKLAEMSQQQVDAIVRAIAEAGERHAERLGRLACNETGFGIAQDKMIKNLFASRGVWERIKDLKTVGILSEDKDGMTMDVAVPVGVIAGLVPSTNPTSTILYKAEIAIKAGNAIVFSPHPNARECSLETVRIIREAIKKAGGDEALVSAVSQPTLESTQALMHHKGVQLILATGGSAMVRAAYSSGTPAIGVGPGNGPAYIERSADLENAVRRILESKTFDNGTICASEQSVICETDRAEAVRAELKRQGAYFISKEQADKLGKFILRASGTMNPAIVGKSAQKIAQLAGIEVPDEARVLVAEENGVGKGHPYSNEKLCPILAFYHAADYKAVCQQCISILNYEGAGHSFMLHTKNKEIIEYFALRIPVSRFLVNTAGALGGVGATTNLMPAYTLGCGAVGGSSAAENVGPMSLINIRKVAHGVREVAELRRMSPGTGETNRVNPGSIDRIVEEVLARIKEL